MNYTPRHPARLSAVEVRGVAKNLYEWGDSAAETLLFLHGWGDTGAGFQFVADELADRWHILAPDWRGFGRSGHNAASYWFPDYLADLDQLIEQQVADDAVKIVGHSMGANVAGLYAGAMPERVSHFVNVEGFGLPESDPADSPGRYRDWLLRSRKTPRLRGFPDVETLARHLMAQSPLLEAERAEFVARQWAEETADGLRLRMDANHKLPNPVLYRRAEAEACWSAIKARVLLVTGSESRIAAHLNAAQESKRARHFFPHAETLIVDGAGHMIHYEAPRELASAIDRFMCL